MNDFFSNLCIALLAALCLASCTSFSQPDLIALADRALNVAVATGKIKPAEAELVREGGALVMAAASKEQIPLERLSQLAVKIAVAEGGLTPEEAALLTAEKSVPLTPAD